MRTLAAAAALVVLLLAGCGSRGPDVAACKAAMKQQLAHALADPQAPAATRPAACRGIDDKTLNRLATQVLSGQ